MERPSIFSFSDYRDYLRVAGNRCFSKRTGRVTLDRFAAKLGYKSPRGIAMVLKGQRVASTEMIRRVSRYFGHTETEHRYLELLVALDRQRRRKLDPRPLLESLRQLSQSQDQTANIDAATFAFIADWYHFVIKQLIAAPGFVEDEALIARRLRNRISATDARMAIDNMLRAGVLERGSNGRLRVTAERLRTTQEIPDVALRRHHRGMITRALEEIDAEGFHEREITSVTLRFDPARIVEAKKWIREFRDRFHQHFDCDSSQHVYQLNFQFFQHTNRKVEDPQ